MPLIRKSSTGPATVPDDEASSLAALTAGSSDERWAAARACPVTPGGIEALSQALAKEVDATVREAQFTRLARAATPESAAAVIPFLRHDDASVRTGALDALRAMSHASEPYLASLLADPDPDVRLLACEIVRNIASTKADQLLCDLLEREEHANVCASAVEVLAEIGSAEALPFLARLADRFREEPFLIFAINVASKRIADQGGPMSESRA